MSFLCIDIAIILAACLNSNPEIFGGTKMILINSNDTSRSMWSPVPEKIYSVPKLNLDAARDSTIVNFPVLNHKLRKKNIFSFLFKISPNENLF